MEEGHDYGARVSYIMGQENGKFFLSNAATSSAEEVA